MAFSFKHETPVEMTEAEKALHWRLDSLAAHHLGSLERFLYDNLTPETKCRFCAEWLLTENGHQQIREWFLRSWNFNRDAQYNTQSYLILSERVRLAEALVMTVLGLSEDKKTEDMRKLKETVERLSAVLDVLEGYYKDEGVDVSDIVPIDFTSPWTTQ